MSGSILTAAQTADYLRDGYVTVRCLFDAEEIALLRRAIETDPALQGSVYDRKDTAGRATRMATWNHPGDSVYGLAARSHRVVDTMEDLLGGEVYHYHSKLTAKEPEVGGAWEWHQDYGYWYHNGCVFPLMASVMVALDASNRENGCLQVVRGSHLVGRIEHGVLPGDQVGADPRRVDEILKRLPVDFAELEPGDGLFFHSNVLHRSDQ
ncbi:MAG: phytanoyl-CoA dioxygenase family protein, partial [Betaproteobacteria bacterium]